LKRNNELSREARHKIGGRDDRDMPKWVEREQIGTAGDDQVGMAVIANSKNFVIRDRGTPRSARQ
jgi:hypothetical protein